VAQARRRVEAFVRRYRDHYPAAVRCLPDTMPELTRFLRSPREHWQRIRHTNLIERTFGEARRRVKVIGRLPGERSYLSLVWAVLDRAARGQRGGGRDAGRGAAAAGAAPPAPAPSRPQEGVVDQTVTPAA
jgi:transposase-like protein